MPPLSNTSSLTQALRCTRADSSRTVPLQSVMELNGGSVVAMVGKECVAIACDLRLGNQALTVACNFEKVGARGLAAAQRRDAEVLGEFHRSFRSMTDCFWVSRASRPTP